MDGGEGFAPAFEPGGFEALEDVEGGELAEGGEAHGGGDVGVGVACFKRYVGGGGGWMRGYKRVTSLHSLQMYDAGVWGEVR